ncbi:MAG: hypothetical protein GY731_07070 [Gammaproteobacteria bacterium]|nr:hypothetical protein [Gammaproteobacteria bacterium]
MIGLTIFLTEICLSLTASILALFLLKSALQTVLTDLFHGVERKAPVDRPYPSTKGGI